MSNERDKEQEAEETGHKPVKIKEKQVSFEGQEVEEHEEDEPEAWKIHKGGTKLSNEVSRVLSAIKDFRGNLRKTDAPVLPTSEGHTMKKPAVFTGDYWRAEWAGLKAAKYRMALFFVALFYMENSIVNNGFIEFRIPRTEYLIYYFGWDPAFFGILAGVFLATGFSKARSAGEKRRKELLSKKSLPWHVAQPGDSDYGNPHEDTRVDHPTTGG